MAGGRRPYISVLLLLSLLLLVTLTPLAEAYSKQKKLRPQQCKKKCDYRCSATSHKKPCKLYCNKCCVKCLCVPPGVYGNKQVCPCYNNWKTQEGKPKCP